MSMTLEDRVRVAAMRDGWQLDRVSYHKSRLPLRPDSVAEEGILLLLLALNRELTARESRQLVALRLVRLPPSLAAAQERPHHDANEQPEGDEQDAAQAVGKHQH